MEFKGQYLTHLEYLQLGGTIPAEMPFNLLEFNARKNIDKYTSGRLMTLDKQSQEVKLCVFELIEKLKSYSLENSEVDRTVASESTDGYTISYNTDFTTLTKGKEAEIQDIIYNDLANLKTEDGTPVLYRG